MKAPVGRAHRAKSRIAGSAPIGRRGGSLPFPPAADRGGRTHVVGSVFEQLGLICGLALAVTAPVWIGSDAVLRLVEVLLSPLLN